MRIFIQAIIGVRLRFKDEPKDLETTEKLCHNFFRRINRARKEKRIRECESMCM